MLMNKKKQYNKEGISNLKILKSKMNKSRLFKEKYDFC